MFFRGSALGDDPGFWSSFASGLPTGFIAASPPAPVLPTIVPGTGPGTTSSICPAGSILVGTMCMPTTPPTPWYFSPLGIGILAIGGFVAYKMFKSSPGSTAPKKEPTP